MDKFKFVIDGNWLYIADDCVRLDLVKRLSVEVSCKDSSKYAIHLHTANMTLELYYTSENKEEIQDVCDELFFAIVEAKEEVERSI